MSDDPDSTEPLAPEPPPPDLPPHDPTGLGLARNLARSVAKRRTPRRRTSTPRTFVERQSSGAHPDARDPKLLSDAMEQLVESRGWTTDLNVHTLLARWGLLAGSGIAEHSRPEAYANSVLTLRTDSTAWATQLRMMAPRLVAMLNEQLGDGTITTIKILGPDAPSWKKGPRSVRDGRGPRDTYG